MHLFLCTYIHHLTLLSGARPRQSEDESTQLACMHQLTGAPCTSGARTGEMAVKFSIFRSDGSLAGSEVMTLHMHIGGGSCPVRTTAARMPESGRVHWMTVGFDGAQVDQKRNTSVVLDSVEEWLASLGVTAQHTVSHAALQLGKHDVLLLVLNANSLTVPHAMELLLRQREQAAGKGAGRVGVVHVNDSEEAGGKHFYGRLDFVLGTYCRHALHRHACVPVGLAGELMALPSALAADVKQEASESSREYVWAFVGISTLPAHTACLTLHQRECPPVHSGRRVL